MAVSNKQLRYALHLLAENGYPTRYMSAQFRELGATMRERSGTVDNWLRGMTEPEISALISKLEPKG